MRRFETPGGAAMHPMYQGNVLRMALRLFTNSHIRVCLEREIQTLADKAGVNESIVRLLTISTHVGKRIASFLII